MVQVFEPFPLVVLLSAGPVPDFPPQALGLPLGLLGRRHALLPLLIGFSNHSNLYSSAVIPIFSRSCSHLSFLTSSGTCTISNTNIQVQYNLENGLIARKAGCCTRGRLLTIRYLPPTTDDIYRRLHTICYRIHKVSSS